MKIVYQKLKTKLRPKNDDYKTFNVEILIYNNVTEHLIKHNLAVVADTPPKAITTAAKLYKLYNIYSITIKGAAYGEKTK